MGKKLVYPATPRETPAPTHVQSLLSRALVLCAVLARS